MRFVWHRENVEHVARHGLSPSGPDEAHVITAHPQRGRPPKGVKVEPGRVRSVRIPDSTWRALQRQAKASGLSTNAAVRLAVLSWTEHSAERG